MQLLPKLGEFPSAKSGGRPRNVAIYAVVNAIVYYARDLHGEDYQEISPLGKQFMVIFGDGLPETSETFIYVAMIRIMIRRLG